MLHDISTLRGPTCYVYPQQSLRAGGALFPTTAYRYGLPEAGPIGQRPQGRRQKLDQADLRGAGLQQAAVPCPEASMPLS